MVKNESYRKRAEAQLNKYKIKRTGQENINNQGLKMIITDYIQESDVEVTFEDGTKVHCGYSAFKKGAVNNPNHKSSEIVRKEKERVGEKNVNNQNLMMEIIKYNGYKNITVRFEDGFEKHTSYTSFKMGKVKNPNFKTIVHAPIKNPQRLGEEKINNQGLHMIITEYVNSANVVVEFDDHYVCHTNYHNFKNGSVHNPHYKGYSSGHTEKRIKMKEERMGMEVYNSKSLKMKVIEYIDSNNIIVQFEDGATKQTTFSSFKIGRVAHPDDSSEGIAKKYIGKSIINKEGYTVTIIKYLSWKEVTVEFNDKNKTQKTVSYYSFKNNSIKLFDKTKENRIGQKRICAQTGQEMTVIEYKDANNVFIEINDDNKTQKWVKWKPFNLGIIEESTVPKAKRRKVNKYDLSGEYGIGYIENSFKFYFDKNDFDLIKNRLWNINTSGYIYSPNGKKDLYMHSIIAIKHGADPDYYEKGFVCDHINRIKHDNRSENLRIVTPSGNSHNTIRAVTGGVYQRNDKWRAILTTEDKKTTWLGTFDTEEEARAARKVERNKVLNEVFK